MTEVTPTWGFYGPCVGGPSDGKNMIHALPHYNVALRDSKPVTFTQRPDMDAEAKFNVRFGRYDFDHDAKVWRWHAPE